MKIYSRRKDAIVVEDCERVSLTPGETLLITVDVGNMPPTAILKQLTAIKERFVELFPGTQIIVVPSTVTVQVIKP